MKGVVFILVAFVFGEAMSFLRYNKYIDEISDIAPLLRICGGQVRTITALVSVHNNLMAAYDDQGRSRIVKRSASGVNYPIPLSPVKDVGASRPSFGFSLWAYSQGNTRPNYAYVLANATNATIFERRAGIMDKNNVGTMNRTIPVDQFRFLSAPGSGIVGVLEVPTDEKPRTFYMLVVRADGSTSVYRARTNSRNDTENLPSMSVSGLTQQGSAVTITAIAAFNVAGYLKQDEKMIVLIAYGHYFRYASLDFSPTSGFSFTMVSPHFESAILFGCPPILCQNPHIDALYQHNTTGRLILISGNYWWNLSASNPHENYDRPMSLNDHDRIRYYSSIFNTLSSPVECAFHAPINKIVLTSWRNVWEGVNNDDNNNLMAQFSKWDKDKYFKYQNYHKNMSRHIEFSAALNDFQNPNVVYLFHMDVVYKFTVTSVEMTLQNDETFLEDPQPTALLFPGLPSDLDAANTDYQGKRIYATKGAYMYIFDVTEPFYVPLTARVRVGLVQDELFECSRLLLNFSGRPYRTWEEYRAHWDGGRNVWAPQPIPVPPTSNYWRNVIIAMVVLKIIGVLAIFVSLYVRRPREQAPKRDTHSEKSSTKFAEAAEVEKGVVEITKETFKKAKSSAP